MTPTLLAERYRIDRQIGVGGMGTVFVASDERLGRDVAVKLLKEDLSSDDRFIERFRREARAAAALSHPNIANVFDYGEEDGRYFIVMELVVGRDLARVMREEGPLGTDRALAITEQIARALGHAHAAGLIHRDVKPHNVIITDEDKAKVTDFGIARATGLSTLTATGTMLGTAQYVSPEQASGEPPGPPSDVYSLGIVLFELVTGAVPFTGDSPVSVALRHVREAVPAPTSIDPSLPAHIDDLIATATAKQPEDRFLDGNAFAAAIAGDDPTPTRVVTSEAPAAWPFAHPPRWDARRLGRTVLIVFVVLFLSALSALAFRLANMEPKPGRQTGGGTANETPAERTGNESPAPATFEMPDYRGQPAAPAIEELQANGIDVTPVEEECGQPFEYVCEQEPEPGVLVMEGASVTLVISASEDDEEKSGEDGDSSVGKNDKVPPGQEKKEEDD